MFRLGLDIDGCINDFSSLIYKYASVFSEDKGIYKEFDMSDYYLERFYGWSQYMSHEFWTRYYKLALEETVPLPGARETISELKSKGVKIYLITARKEKYREITVNWLKSHQIPFDKLIMSSEKATVCLENHIDIMVEDEPDNCKSISSSTRVLCMAYKYNEGLKALENIERVSDWTEIYNIIMQHIKAEEVI